MKNIAILACTLFIVIGCAKEDEENQLSCNENKDNSDSFTVACNINTSDEYYWAVGERQETYGYWGLINSGVEPACDSASVGNTAQTAAWSETTSDDGYWTVYTDWCKNDAMGGGQESLNPGCSTDTGRDFGACGEHCGIYLATCTKNSSENI